MLKLSTDPSMTFFWLLLGMSLICAAISWVLGVKPAIFLIGILVIGAIFGLNKAKDNQEALLFVVLALLIPIVSVCGLGFAAGAAFKDRRYLKGAALLAPLIVFCAFTNFKQVFHRDLEKRGMEFIASEPRLAKLLGKPLEPVLYTRTMNDSAKQRFEYSFIGHDAVFAVVEVTIRNLTPSYRLVCVTSVSAFRRDHGDRPCEKGEITLPPVD